MKYRIWSKKSNRWMTSEVVVTSEGRFLSLSIRANQGNVAKWNVTDIDSIDLIIEIWTGLFDKNKKEIYVGDILDNGNKYNDSRSQVIWQDSAAACRAIVGDGQSGIFNLVHTGYMCEGKSEIVGNIHETPKLLKNECIKI